MTLCDECCKMNTIQEGKPINTSFCMKNALKGIDLNKEKIFTCNSKNKIKAKQKLPLRNRF